MESSEKMCRQEKNPTHLCLEGSSPHRLPKGPIEKICLRGKENTIMNEFKHLGVILDSKLPFKSHKIKRKKKRIETFNSRSFHSVLFLHSVTFTSHSQVPRALTFLESCLQK